MSDFYVAENPSALATRRWEIRQDLTEFDPETGTRYWPEEYDVVGRFATMFLAEQALPGLEMDFERRVEEAYERMSTPREY